MKILYGGAFNPPTQAHLNIIKYLIKQYPTAQIILLPSNENYKEDIIPYKHRKKMLELIINETKKNVIISNYEARKRKFLGTYYTLKAFSHPFFVLGADQILKLEQWIKFPLVVSENKFIVFPRDGIKAKEYISQHPILSPLLQNFIFINDFEESQIASSQYRLTKNDSILPSRVKDYILKHKLYHKPIVKE